MRGKRAKERKIKPDAIYNNLIIAKFINNVMQKGKKPQAEKIVYSALDIVSKELKQKPIEALEKAIENAKPKLEIRPRRVGGVTYQVPLPVQEGRQTSLAVKWIIQGARDRRKKEEFYLALAEELRDAVKGTGFAIKKRDEMHRTAEANKAFAHFQW